MSTDLDKRFPLGYGDISILGILEVWTEDMGFHQESDVVFIPQGS